jgi:hypothetical protein
MIIAAKLAKNVTMNRMLKALLLETCSTETSSRSLEF